MDGFQYQMKVFYGASGAVRMVPSVLSLPTVPGVHDVVVLEVQVGHNVPGLYMFGSSWRFIAHTEVLNAALADGRPVAVYSQLTVTTVVGATSIVYINSALYNSNVLNPGTSVYVVVEPAVPGPGPEADSSVFVGVASIALSGQRVVKLNGTSVSYMDNADVANAFAGIGITMESANQGQPIKVKLYGDLNEPTWNFQLGKPVFCGVNGVLTQQSPTQGFSLVVGVAAGPTKMIVAVKQPIVLT